ncbi:MAG: glycoside hydrolase family 19 protein [Zoogloea sp.]|nr:glycoside hydrolase family 19 protein [Zoogloea sp.]
MKAFGEVVAPFSRGLDVLGRKSDGRQEGLLKKIWKTLKGIEEKAANPAQAESGGGIFMLLGRFLPLLLPALVGLTAVVAGVKAFLGIKGFLEDDEKAAKAAEDIKKDVAEPLKDNLKAAGIDSDKRIADARAATLERRDGEYAKEDQARAAFAKSSGMKPGNTAFEDAFYKDQQAKEAAAADQAKKGLVQRGFEKVKEVGRSLFGNRHKDAMVSQMAAAGITDPKEQAMFMAQLDHESGGFSKTEESFKYRSADRLMQVSASARKMGKPAVEQALAKGPEAIAELMYGGRMGNISPGDAFAFRGRGAIQLTGRDNYTRAGKALGLDLANHPELAADPENSAKIAAWYWKTNKLSTAAKNGDVRAVTKTINGGINGLDDRTAKFGKYLSAAKAGAFNVSPATASIPAARPVRAPSMPAIAEAPAVQVPLGSGAPSGPVMVSLQGGDVRQDLSDRRMAHIATGGVAN